MVPWQTAEEIRTVMIVNIYPHIGYTLICLSSLFVTEKNTFVRKLQIVLLEKPANADTFEVLSKLQA